MTSVLPMSSLILFRLLWLQKPQQAAFLVSSWVSVTAYYTEQAWCVGTPKRPTDQYQGLGTADRRGGGKAWSLSPITKLFYLKWTSCLILLSSHILKPTCKSIMLVIPLRATGAVKTSVLMKIFQRSEGVDPRRMKLEQWLWLQQQKSVMLVRLCWKAVSQKTPAPDVRAAVLACRSVCVNSLVAASQMMSKSAKTWTQNCSRWDICIK